MGDFVILLRGVNVGGRSTLSMPRVREVLAAGGYGRVETYVQSGNVLVESGARSAERVAASVEQLLREAFEREIAVVARSAAEFRRVIDANPYADRLAAGAPGTAVHVAFLRQPPGPALAEVDAARFAPEEFRAAGREVYLYLPNGIGRSRLAAELSQRRLEAAATVRNWNTVAKLGELLARRS